MSRIAKFTQKMIEAGADAALISSELNIRYLSNFNFTDGYILVTRNRAYLITEAPVGYSGGEKNPFEDLDGNPDDDDDDYDVEKE